MYMDFCFCSEQPSCLQPTDYTVTNGCSWLCLQYGAVVLVVFPNTIVKTSIFRSKGPIQSWIFSVNILLAVLETQKYSISESGFQSAFSVCLPCPGRLSNSMVSFFFLLLPDYMLEYKNLINNNMKFKISCAENFVWE